MLSESAEGARVLLDSHRRKTNRDPWSIVRIYPSDFNSFRILSLSLCPSSPRSGSDQQRAQCLWMAAQNIQCVTLVDERLHTNKDRRRLPGQRADCEDGIEIEAPLYLYLLFVAPDDDFAALQATFNRMMNSLQLR